MALKSDQQRCIAHECGYRVSVEHVCLRQESFFINLYFIHWIEVDAEEICIRELTPNTNADMPQRTYSIFEYYKNRFRM